MENNTYLLVVDSCEKISVRVDFPNIPANRVRNSYKAAKGAFRQVDVTNEQTGEIVLSFYADSDWHLVTSNYGEAIDAICHIAYDQEE